MRFKPKALSNLKESKEELEHLCFFQNNRFLNKRVKIKGKGREDLG